MAQKYTHRGSYAAFLSLSALVVCSRHAGPMVLASGTQTGSGTHFQSAIEQFMQTRSGRMPPWDSRFCSHSCIMFPAIPAVLVRSTAVPSDTAMQTPKLLAHLSTRRRAVCTGSRSSVPTCCAAGIDNRSGASTRARGKHQRDAWTPGPDQPVHADQPGEAAHRALEGRLFDEGAG